MGFLYFLEALLQGCVRQLSPPLKWKKQMCIYNTKTAS